MSRPSVYELDDNERAALARSAEDEAALLRPFWPQGSDDFARHPLGCIQGADLITLAGPEPAYMWRRDSLDATPLAITGGSDALIRTAERLRFLPYFQFEHP